MVAMVDAWIRIGCVKLEHLIRSHNLALVVQFKDLKKQN